MQKLFILVIFSLLINLVTDAQTTNNAFSGGEKLRFIGSYYVSEIWSDIGELNLNVNNVTTTKGDVLHLQAIASTYISWDKYFKVRDLYQSWVDPITIKPLVFKRDMLEGSYTKNLKYIFKKNLLTAMSDEILKNGKSKQMLIKLVPNTHDLISVLYYIRTLNYEQLPINNITTITVLIDEKLEIINVKYKGIESIKVGKYGNLKCYKLGVSIKNEKIVKTKETNNIWITADDNKVPVLIKADIKVGSIQFRLVDMNGLKR